MRVNQFFLITVATFTGLAVALCLTLSPAAQAKSLPDHQAAPAATADSRPEQSQVSKLAKYIQEKYKVSAAQTAAVINEALRSGAAHGLDPTLILAMIAVESNFRDKALNPRGTRGLLPVSADKQYYPVKEIGGSHSVARADKNMYAGAKILADYLKDHNGNLRTALLSYSGNLKNPKSAYPDRVLRVYQDFRQAAW